LVLPLVLQYGLISETGARIGPIGLAVALVALVAVGWSWWQSKRESPEMRKMDEEFTRAAAGAADEAKVPVGSH